MLCIIFESMNFFKFESQWVLECAQIYTIQIYSCKVIINAENMNRITAC